MNYKIYNKHLICIGDIHGQFERLTYNIKNYISKCSLTDAVFVVCGDCGFGFNTNEYTLWKFNESKELNNIIKNANSELYFFRGNHDNPDIFNNNKSYITCECDSIKVLNDYDILDSDLYGRILIVPGAISIDRYNRTLNFSYWSDERVVQLNDDELNAIGKVDIILSHNLPYFNKISKYIMKQLEESETIMKKYYDNLGYSNPLSVDLDNERKYLIHLQDIVKASVWISGHYHEFEETVIEDTTYIALNIEQFYSPSYF